ncbi:hypothetical protein [Methanobrevibacter sp.]|uniref:hypothetical protein n=1 Tax=Methanobrevibacter sp. TaxID=66852 RepID=UPI00386D43D9
MQLDSNPLFTQDCDAGIYSKSMKHLQYVPTMREKISPERCYNNEKCEELKKEIKEANLPKDVTKMLLLAATRHIVFNYQMVAEFYSQADKKVQELMEKSGLVIIDFDDAMENGFVELTQTLKELRNEAENITE